MSYRFTYLLTLMTVVAEQFLPHYPVYTAMNIILLQFYDYVNN